MISQLEETRDFRRVAEVLFLKNWAEASAGNMSLRLAAVPPALAAQVPVAGRMQKSQVDMTDLIGDCFLVTASGSRMRDIAGEPEKGLCLIKVIDERAFLARRRGRTAEQRMGDPCRPAFSFQGEPQRRAGRGPLPPAQPDRPEPYFRF